MLVIAPKSEVPAFPVKLNLTTRKTTLFGHIGVSAKLSGIVCSQERITSRGSCARLVHSEIHYILLRKAIDSNYERP